MTVAAAVSMVLLAMLVPMAVLIQDYALEDRLAARGAGGAGHRDGGLARRHGRHRDLHRHHQRGPGDPDERASTRPRHRTSIGPIRARTPSRGGPADRRRPGRRRRRWCEILVPVSLGGTATAPRDPGDPGRGRRPGLGSGIVRAWLVLAALGLVLLLGALLLADRLGRSFVQPIQALAAYAAALGDVRRPEPVEAAAPPEIRELATALNRLVGRVDVPPGSGSARRRRPVSPAADPGHCAAAADRLAPDRRPIGTAWPLTSTSCSAMVDQSCARRAAPSARGWFPSQTPGRCVAERARFWEPLAEDQGRRVRSAASIVGPVAGAAAEEDLVASSTCCWTTSSPTPRRVRRSGSTWPPP